MLDRMEKGPKQYKTYLIQNQIIQLCIDGCFIGLVLYGMHFFDVAKGWRFALYGLLVIDIILRLIRPYLIYSFYAYQIVNDTIVIQRGIWFRKYEAVKIERIQFLESHFNPLSRYHHLSQIKVVTAGHDIELPYLNHHQSEEIEKYCLASLERGEADV
ncbi:PH domain-containing protein [Staphylococcus chromogenes]|uniref:PH domain-containing protein n=1 Tax=Staphylococcus chromogenes TaxID=46126 RepID=UPI0021CF012C|nr:PH domain-containing protein [Staphylococcus chromogenes]UXS76140.1 PH domain-containing protein [Staphylococcus chromogenes]